MKNLIRCMVGLVLVIGTLIALFYAEENWRGGNAWEKVETELKAKGEPLTLAEVIPSEVPEQFNMGSTSVWKEVFTASDSKDPSPPKARIQNLRLGDPKIQTPMGSSIKRGENFSLPPWAEYLAGTPKGITNEAASEALENYFANQAPLAKEVSDSLRMPYKRWPLRYGNGFNMRYPHIGTVLDVGRFFQTRATIQLLAGNEQQAREDLQSIWLLAESFKNDPTLIGALVSITLDGFVTPVIWEGLADQKWSSATLEQFKKTLKVQRAPALIVTSLRGERVSFLDIVTKMKPGDFLGITGVTNGDLNFWSKVPSFLYLYFRPQGWIDQDKVLYAKTLQNGIEWHLELIKGGHFPSDFARTEGNFGLPPLSALERLEMPLSSLALPSISACVKKVAETETYQRMALIACAIEQCRLATGHIPEALENLVPAYLESVPVDVVNGQPLHYVHKNGEGYLLYSVGMNGSDDGGYTSKNKETGDWVWPSRAGLVEVREK